MTRIALLVVLIGTLAVAGTVFVQLDSDAEDQLPEEQVEAMNFTRRGGPDTTVGDRSSPTTDAPPRSTSTTTRKTSTTEVDDPGSGGANGGGNVTTTTTRSRRASATPTTEASSPTTTEAAPNLPTPTGEKFDIILSNADTNVHWWTAPYARDLPYTAGVGWTDGDRSGYKCAYMHLFRNGNPNDIVGRVTFSRPLGQTYGKVNDSRMLEGQSSSRAYDGGLDWASQAECPDPDEDYQPLPANTKDVRPKIFYVDSKGNLLENRSYTNTTGDAIVKGTLIFQDGGLTTKPFTDTGGISSCDDYCTVYERQKVIAYEFDDGEWLPAMTIYYDILVPDVTFKQSW